MGKKRGRPSKDSGELRNKQFRILLTKDESFKLYMMAKMNGVSKSDYVRMALEYYNQMKINELDDD